VQSRGDRGRRWQLHRLDRLGVGHLPFTLKVLLENLLRHEDGRLVTAEQVEAVRRWDPAAERPGEVDLHPTRVFLHDTNGVPAASTGPTSSAWCPAHPPGPRTRTAPGLSG
jgi:aconitase A